MRVIDCRSVPMWVKSGRFGSLRLLHLLLHPTGYLRFSVNRAGCLRQPMWVRSFELPALRKAKASTLISVCSRKLPREYRASGCRIETHYGRGFSCTLLPLIRKKRPDALKWYLCLHIGGEVAIDLL